MSNLTSCI